MKRFHDWPQRLAEHILSAREAKFRWGHFDCALFAAGAIHAMTGTDLAADFRGKYHDEAGARALFARAIAHAGGVLRLVDLGFAARGDLVLTNNGSTEPGLGIVGLDGNKALCAGERGLSHIARAHWLRTWHV
jgi:hypothetical protein